MLTLRLPRSLPLEGAQHHKRATVSTQSELHATGQLTVSDEESCTCTLRVPLHLGHENLVATRRTNVDMVRVFSLDRPALAAKMFAEDGVDFRQGSASRTVS